MDTRSANHRSAASACAFLHLLTSSRSRRISEQSELFFLLARRFTEVKALVVLLPIFHLSLASRTALEVKMAQPPHAKATAKSAALRASFSTPLTSTPAPARDATAGPAHRLSNEDIRAGYQLHGRASRRCCTNRQWPARGQSTGSSPADAIRHWSAEGGHPIEDLTAENGLTPLPSWTPGAKAIADDGLVAEKRILHPALTMVP